MGFKGTVALVLVALAVGGIAGRTNSAAQLELKIKQASDRYLEDDKDHLNNLQTALTNIKLVGRDLKGVKGSDKVIEQLKVLEIEITASSKIAEELDNTLDGVEALLKDYNSIMRAKQSEIQKAIKEAKDLIKKLQGKGNTHDYRNCSIAGFRRGF